MSDDEESFNQSFFECEIRKQKYKELLDYGREAAEKVEISSFVDNINIFTELVIESNKLCEQANLGQANRVGQSGEVVLDAQVCLLHFRCFSKYRLMILIVSLFRFFSL